MDLRNEQEERHDEFVVAAATAAAGIAKKLAPVLKNFAGNVRHKAQLKAGLKHIADGHLDKLNGGMLDQIIVAGTDPKYYVESPVYIKRYAASAAFRAAMQPRLAQSAIDNDPDIVNQPGVTQANVVEIAAAKEAAAAEAAAAPSMIKKYGIYIGGAIAIGIIIFFIVKRK